jgi:hypothetical protein
VQQLSAKDGDRLTSQVRAIAIETNPHRPSPRRSLIADQLAFTEPGCPVTGSSSIPAPGAKNRDTKSWEPLSERAVTMTPRTPSRASAFRSGAKDRTAVSD